MTGASPLRVDGILPRPRVCCQVAGLTLVTVAAPISAWLAATASGRAWSEIIDDTMSDRSGAWHFMRGGLAFLVIPALLLVLALILLFLYRRRSMRSVVVLGIIVLLSNLTAQFVKHAPFGLGEAWPTLNPLSGHVAVVTSISLGWLVVVPARLKPVSTVSAIVTIGGVSCGVMLAGWHTPFQVLCPVLISTGWAILCAPYADMSDEQQAARATGERPWLDGALVFLGLSSLTLVAFHVGHRSGDSAASVWSIALALLGAAGASSTSVGLVAHATRAVRLEAATRRNGAPEPGQVSGDRSRERSVT